MIDRAGNLFADAGLPILLLPGNHDPAFPDSVYSKGKYAQIPSLAVPQVRAAREAGFASLWFPHHWLTHPLQMLQITPVMGYLAAHAQGMTLGPNILILQSLNPVHVAEEAATLDVLIGGKFILGVGLGYRQPEFDAFGVSLKERAPRFVDSIASMRRLWTEDRVSHKGRFTASMTPGSASSRSAPAARALHRGTSRGFAQACGAHRQMPG